jgi:hypothetical protein
MHLLGGQAHRRIFHSRSPKQSILFAGCAPNGCDFDRSVTFQGEIEGGRARPPDEPHAGGVPVRHKLTFCDMADVYIDFRDRVRELFKVFVPIAEEAKIDFGSVRSERARGVDQLRL